MGLIDRGKRLAHGALQQLRLRGALRRLARLPLGALPDPALLSALHAAWGNAGFSAVPAFLAEVAARATVETMPILECGSGLTTLVLGVLAGRRGIPVWSLEHNPAWHARVAGALRAAGIAGVHLSLVPIERRGDYSWYAAPTDLPAQFGLVVCDGPPGDTPGGRYGLLPTMGGRLRSGSVVLLDDTARAAERETAERWSQEGGFDLAYGTRPGGSFAILTRR